MQYGVDIKQRVKDQRILHEVTIELTYKCNLDCFFCYNDREKQGEILSVDQYRTLLEDLAQMQTLHLMLTGGEPMVHPHFFEIGRIAKELGFAVRVRTNGHSLSKANVQRLKDEVDPFYIEVSIHGATADVHDRQTRIPGSFERLLKNIRHCQDQNMDVRAVSTPTSWNEHQIKEIIELCEKIGIHLRFQGPVAPRDNGDLTPLQITPKPETWDKVRKLSPRLKGALTEQEVKPIEIQPAAIGLSTASSEPRAARPSSKSSATCSVGVAGVDIDPYGNVQACMHLQESAGNLHENSIIDIWSDSPLFLRARERAIEAAKPFQNEEPRQLGAHLFCLAVEENLAKGGYTEKAPNASPCGSSISDSAK